MQGQRQQGNAPGKGGKGTGDGNGTPGRRTLTMGLPPRRGSSSSDDGFESFSDDSDEESRDRDRAQRSLLDSAISPHLPDGNGTESDDDEEFFSLDSSSEEEVAPPDEQALFGDGEEWDQVHEVEAETEKRASNPTPETAHSGWRSWAWSGMMGGLGAITSFGSSVYNRQFDVSSMTYRIQQWLIAKLNSTLNVTDAAITNLRIDGGLITADSVSAGPLAQSVAGNDILCGGFTLTGLELELSLTDLYALYSGTKPSESITLRFGSIAIPLLQVTTAKAQAETQPTTASSSTQPKPSSDKPLPENIRSLLAALRLGIHLGSIDVQLHSQTDDGFTCGVTIEHGAVRVLPDSGAFKAVKHLTKKHVLVDGKLYTVAELRAHVRSLEGIIRDSPHGPLFQRTLDGIPDQIRAALLEDGFTDDDRAALLALIAYIGGNATALFDHDQAISARDAKKEKDDVEPKAKQREETARRIEQLGDRYDTGGAAGRFRLHDIHGGVVGSQFATDGQTRGELHVGGVHAEGVNANVGGFATKVTSGDVGPVDIRMIDDQIGVNVSGARVKGAEAFSQDGTGGFVEKLKLKETRASARTGDVLHPTDAIEGNLHLGGVTVTGGGGTSGDFAAVVDRVDVGQSDVAIHKQGDQQGLDASGLEVDVGQLTGALNADTAFSAGHLHLAPSKAHGERTPTGKTDGTVQVGALDASKLSVSQPRANLAGGADQLHVGSIGATVVDDPTTKHRAGAFQLGTIDAHGVGGNSGAMGGSIEHAFVGPTKVGVDQHGDDARVDATGLALNLGGLGGTLDAETTVAADSLRLEPSTVHGERKGGVLGGTVTTGTLEVDDVVADRKQRDEHAELANLHLGGVTASKHGDQTSAAITDLGLTKLSGHRGAQSGSLGALKLDTLNAGGDLEARDGQLHAGTVTAGPLDLSNGKEQAHVDQLVVDPTDAHVGPSSATFSQQGIHARGLHLTGHGGSAHAGGVDTGLLEGEYGPRVDQKDQRALDVHLASASVTKVDAGQLTTEGSADTLTTLHLGGAELHGLHGRARDDGGVEGKLGGASLDDLEASRVRQDRDAEQATPQDWHQHTDTLHLGHAGVGKVALQRPEGKDVPVGRRDLAIEGVGVNDLDITTRDASDRHDHLERKAKLNVDVISGNLEAEKKIAERKRKEAEEARQLPPVPEKKPSSVLGKVEHKVTGGVKKLFGKKKDKNPGEKEVKQAEKRVKDAEKKLESARKEAERVEKKQQEAAEKEARKDKHAKTKDRGNHHHVEALTLDSFDAELSGFDSDAPTVDSASLGTLEGAHLIESRLRDDDDRLTVDVEDMTLAVDEHGDGTVTVHAVAGKDMLENLAGDKLGSFANKLVGLDGNRLTLTIPVVGGVIQLGELQLGTSHNWLRSKLLKQFAKLHIGGDKAQKSLRGRHNAPHLHIPLVGDRQAEHLGLGGLHQPEKKVLISRSIGVKGGGVHLPNLLQTGLQTAIDGALGEETQVHGLSKASVGGVSVDGLDALRRDGARPGDQPVEEVKAAVGKAAVGESALEVDSVDNVRSVMATLAGLFAGTPPTPTTSQEPKPEQTTTTTPPSPGLLDGMFAMLESVLGGQPSTSAQKPSSSSSGSAGKPRLSHLLANPEGTQQLTSFLTAGGGDCGIHAMFGAPTGVRGVVRAADPNIQRKQLGDRLDGSDGHGQAQVNRGAFTQLLAELVLQILTGQPHVELEAEEFAAIHGFFDDMLAAKRRDDKEYAVHTQNSNDFALALVRTFVWDADSVIGELLREQLIQDVLVSNTETDRALRRQLERAPNDQARHVLIMKAGTEHLVKLVIGNLDVLVGTAVSCGAPDWVGDGQQELQDNHALLGGHLRAAVALYLDALLPAYANVVRTPGYYLHDVDLQLLALINDLDLHIYNESDLVGGQFVEQLHQPGNSGNVEVFHSHAHYEQARRQ